MSTLVILSRSSLVAWFTATLATLSVSSQVVGQATDLPEIAIYLDARTQPAAGASLVRAGHLEGTLPYHQPFLLTGAAPSGVNRVLVLWHPQSGPSCLLNQSASTVHALQVRTHVISTCGWGMWERPQGVSGSTDFRVVAPPLDDGALRLVVCYNSGPLPNGATALCNRPAPPPTPPIVTASSVRLFPRSAIALENTGLEFEVEVLDASSQSLTEASRTNVCGDRELDDSCPRATWTVSATSAGPVISPGPVIPASTVGTMTVGTVVGGQTATAQVTAVPADKFPEPRSITIRRERTSLRTRGLERLRAVVRDADGNVLVGHPISWDVSNSAIGFVSGDTLHSKSAGTVRLIARTGAHRQDGGVQDTLTIEVRGPPTPVTRFNIQTHIRPELSGHLQPDFGSGFTPLSTTPVAFIGVHVSWSLNRALPVTSYDRWERWSVYAGLALNAPTETSFEQLFSWGSPITGVGWRWRRTERVILGLLWFDEPEPNAQTPLDVSDKSLRATPFAALSFDASALSKAIGALWGAVFQ